MMNVISHMPGQMPGEPANLMRLKMEAMGRSSDRAAISQAVMPTIDEDIVEFNKESMLSASIELTYEYLRFEVFKDENMEDVKRVFKKIANVPVKQPSLIDEFLSIVKSKNLGELEKFADKNAFDSTKIEKGLEQYIDNIDTLPEELRGMESGLEKKVTIVKKDMNKIIDLYFAHADTKGSMNVLRHLLFITFPNQEEMDAYFTAFMKMPADAQAADRIEWNATLL